MGKWWRWYIFISNAELRSRWLYLYHYIFVSNTIWDLPNTLTRIFLGYFFCFVLVWLGFNSNFKFDDKQNRNTVFLTVVSCCLSHSISFSVSLQITKSWVEVLSSPKTSGWSQVVKFSCLIILQFCLLQLISQSVHLYLYSTFHTGYCFTDDWKVNYKTCQMRAITHKTMH